MKVLVNLDLGNNQILNAVVQSLASAPSSPSAGRIYFDSTLGKIGVYDGDSWEYLGATGGGGGDADTLGGQAGSYYLSRTNHTGSQAISTVTGLQAALDAKAALASPALTGTPTAPTATAGTNTTQLATTAFVQAATAALVDSAPGTLDTLNELAAALGDDPSFATTLSTQIGALDTRLDTVEANATGLTHKFSADIGDGSSTAIVVTHNLGTRDVQVQVYPNASPYDTVYPDVERTSTNTVTIRFATAPASNAYRAVVIG